MAEQVPCDDIAGVSASKASTSRILSYTRRTQRVLIGFLSDVLGENGAIFQEANTDQPADFFTKPLTVVAFWKCLKYFRIG